MKVRELIEVLERLDPDDVVLALEGGDCQSWQEPQIGLYFDSDRVVPGVWTIEGGFGMGSAGIEALMSRGDRS